MLRKGNTGSSGWAPPFPCSEAVRASTGNYNVCSIFERLLHPTSPRPNHKPSLSQRAALRALVLAGQRPGQGAVCVGAACGPAQPRAPRPAGQRAQGAQGAQRGTAGHSGAAQLCGTWLPSWEKEAAVQLFTRGESQPSERSHGSTSPAAGPAARRSTAQQTGNAAPEPQGAPSWLEAASDAERVQSGSDKGWQRRAAAARPGGQSSTAWLCGSTRARYPQLGGRKALEQEPGRQAGTERRGKKK